MCLLGECETLENTLYECTIECLCNRLGIVSWWRVWFSRHQRTSEYGRVSPALCGVIREVSSAIGGQGTENISSPVVDKIRVELLSLF